MRQPYYTLIFGGGCEKPGVKGLVVLVVYFTLHTDKGRMALLCRPKGLFNGEVIYG
jgi:hypothetical protein